MALPVQFLTPEAASENAIFRQSKHNSASRTKASESDQYCRGRYCRRCTCECSANESRANRHFTVRSAHLLMAREMERFAGLRLWLQNRRSTHMIAKKQGSEIQPLSGSAIQLAGTPVIDALCNAAANPVGSLFR